MEHRPLQPITQAEARHRLKRVTSIARRFGFVGRIEYRHVVTDTGGAQYGLATSAEEDLLVVDARAFQRDADPDDFSKRLSRMSVGTRSYIGMPHSGRC